MDIGTKVKVLENFYDRRGKKPIYQGKIGTIVNKAKNYYDEVVFDVNLDDIILRFNINELEEIWWNCQNSD